MASRSAATLNSLKGCPSDELSVAMILSASSCWMPVTSSLETNHCGAFLDRDENGHIPDLAFVVVHHLGSHLDIAESVLLVQIGDGFLVPARAAPRCSGRAGTERISAS